MKHFRMIKTFLLTVLLTAFAAGALARTDKHAKSVSRPRIERVVAADPNVVISLCLVSGDITVRGWDQKQVRVSSSDADQFEFRRAAGISDADAAKEMTVLPSNSSSHRSASCLFDGSVELDVPRGATVRLQTHNGDIKVTGVSSVTASTLNGGVDLDSVKSSVDAKTIGGDLSLRNSTGPAKLQTVGGDIQVSRSGPAAAGDACEATSVGGEIAFNQASYSDLKATTVAGALSLSGPLAAGGRYQFKSISGDVSLALPADSSFRIDATISQGSELVSDFALRLTTDQTRPPTPPTPPRPPAKKHSSFDPSAFAGAFGMQHINGVYGTGDASITVSSFSGGIFLRKK
jgi:hypothetical protein